MITIWPYMHPCLRTIYFPILLSLGILPGLYNLSAQGCSDAGICTNSNFRPSPVDPMIDIKNLLKVNLSTGAADYGITVFGGHISYYRELNPSWSVDTKITFLSQSGNEISVSGPGDIFANLNYGLSSKFTLTGGLKIPLTKGDKSLEDKPLPMDYQSSLGTLDLALGLSYHREKIQWVLAYQQPLTQNENGFFPGLYDTLSPLNNFQATNQFQRKGDIMARISLPLILSDKIIFTPSLLPIFHLGEDEYTDESGVVQPIEGSDGLTINGAFFIDIALSASSYFEVNVGFPFLVRDVRPDGLTRGFVFSAEYAINF